jgi:RNA polymerase sigma-70 factor (ECF subfamily)
MAAADDADLDALSRFRAGDASGFDDLVKKHEAPLRGLIHRYVKNEEDAKDVTQRVFARAFEKLDSFRGESSFRTWLYRIGVNVALNHVRGAAPFANTSSVDDVAAFTSALETSRLVAAEMWRQVSARLEQLPPKQRLVIELRLFHDLSFQEVATIADSTEEAVKANYHHGVKRLRDLLPR